MNEQNVHDVVKERYGGIASGTQSSCCGANDSSDCGCNVNLYDAALIQDLPVDVTELSLGCGETQFHVFSDLFSA